MVAMVDATLMEFIRDRSLRWLLHSLNHPSIVLYIFVFLTYELVVKLSGVNVVVNTFRRVRKKCCNRGVAWGACCLWSVWADLPVLEL